MSTPMARQEAERQPIELGKEDFIGRFTPGARHLLPVRVFNPRQTVKAAAANDPQNGLDHDGLPQSFVLAAPK